MIISIDTEMPFDKIEHSSLPNKEILFLEFFEEKLWGTI